MGWQTDVLTQIVFNRETYNCLYEVEEEIESNNKIIRQLVDEIVVMALSRPEDLLLHNEEMTILDCLQELKDKIESLQGYSINNYKLECLKENFDLRSGDFIDNPNNKEAIKKWLIDNYIFSKEDFK